jgi:hypothetical protein
MTTCNERLILTFTCLFDDVINFGLKCVQINFVLQKPIRKTLQAMKREEKEKKSISK